MLFTVVALASGIGLAWWLEQPSEPPCLGVVACRSTWITSNVDGVVTDLVAEQGTEVDLEQPLLTLADSQLERALQTQRTEVASLQTELERTLAAVDLELNWRMRTIDAELFEMQLQAANILKEKYDHELQRSMLADLLAGEEFVVLDDDNSLIEALMNTDRMPRSKRMATILELETVNNHAEVSAAQLEICEQRQEDLRDLKTNLPDQIRRSLGVPVAEAKLAQAKEELARLEAERESLTLAATAIGKVGVFKVREGDHLRRGTPIVELLDEAKRHLIVEVPSQQITSYAIGTELDLVFPGSCYRTGKVHSIAPQANQRLELGSDATITIQVEQSGQVWPEVPMGSVVSVQLAG